jgi:hypothetical protein
MSGQSQGYFTGPDGNAYCTVAQTGFTYCYNSWTGEWQLCTIEQLQMLSQIQQPTAYGTQATYHNQPVAHQLPAHQPTQYGHA